MKKLVFIAFVTVLVVALSGVVVGEEAKPIKPGRDEVIPAPRAGRLRPKRPDGVGLSAKPSASRNREKYIASKITDMTLKLESQVKAHEDFVSQLEAIKKIAAGEKAKKTVAKIQELIDKEKVKLEKKQTALKQGIEAFKTRMEKGFRQGPGVQRGGGQRPPKGRYGRSGAVGEVQNDGDKGGVKKKK